MSIFTIATVFPDTHAAIIATALQQTGGDCVRWITSNLCSQEVCLEISGDSTVSLSLEEVAKLYSAPIKNHVMVNRRVAREVFPNAKLLCDADLTVSKSENMHFMENILATLSIGAKSINDLYSASRSENKSLQLHCASACGMQTPRTIITNSPSKIKEFIRSNNKCKTIAKPFRPNIWKSDNCDFVCRSAIVTLKDLPSDDVLKLCPMIFQRYVEKSFEVRVTCFGATVVGAMLDSQANDASKIDWRAISVSKLSIAPIKLPKDIEEKCCKLLKILGLKFGCIDMIVTPSNEWVFLEINQMGQFLWIEEVNKDFFMLDLFVQHLKGEIKHGVAKRKYNFNFEEVNHAARSMLASETNFYQTPPETNRIIEKI